MRDHRALEGLALSGVPSCRTGYPHHFRPYRFYCLSGVAVSAIELNRYAVELRAPPRHPGD